MQIMIDSAAESPADLRRIAAMLTFLAQQAELAPLAAATGTAPSVPAGTVAAPEVPAAPIAPSPPVEVMKADAGHVSEVQAPTPAQAFGGASNVVPLHPSVPAAPSPIAGDAGTSAATPVTTGTVELDGAGLPWDQRIHSTPAKKNANGLWRMRRGVDPNVIQTVEAELRVTYPAKQTVIPTAPAAPTVPLPPGVDAGTTSAAPVVPVVPTPPAPVSLPGNAAPGIPPSPPGAAAVPGGADAFRSMMDKFSKEMGPNGRLNKAAIAPFFATIGVSGWGELHKKPELIPGVVAECERLTTAAA